MRRLFLIYPLILLVLSACGQKKDPNISQTQPISYSHEVYVPDVNVGWGMAFLPDNSLLYTERDGELFLFKDKTKIKIQGVPEVNNNGQGGLLDISLHPRYAENKWIYLTYSSKKGSEGSNTVLMRCKLNNNTLTDQQILYKASPDSKTSHHYGSRIAWDPSGYLYFTVGDRGDHNRNPQDIKRDGGKVYRLHDDGSIPNDNPFIQTSGAKKAVYSFGHRNAQGMVTHYQTGKIWLHEHGPQGGDEINIVEKGKNYGWPVVTYGINYDGSVITDQKTAPGMESPIHYWVPSIAPSGMAFVTSDVYPQWKGNLMVGSLRFRYLEMLVMDGAKVIKREKILDNIGRVRDVRQGPDGYLYVSVENKGILKIFPR